MIREGVFGEVEYFKDLVDSVNDVPKSGNDWFLVANDFASYMAVQASPFPPYLYCTLLPLCNPLS